MKHHELGSSGIMVSEAALGCWPFAGDDVWGPQDDNDSIAAVHAALDAGINFFDTAEGYGEGRSERVLARGLAGRREQAVIATKVLADNLAPDDVLRACEGSLRNLETDFIDLYIVHWPNHDIPIADTVGALNRLKEQGKIRAIGVSNFGVGDLTGLLAHERPEIDQLPYNLIWRPIEHEILPKMREHGIGVMVYSPLAQGLLTGRYSSADEVPDGLARSRHFSSTRPMAVHGEPGMEAETFAAIDRVKAIADGLGSPPAHVSVAWLRRQQSVTALLIGARDAGEVAMNLPAFEMVIPDDAAAALEAATDEVKQKLGTSPDMWRAPARYR